MKTAEEIISKFSTIPFAEAKFEQMFYDRVGNDQRVRIILELFHGSSKPVPSVLVFKRCFSVKLEANLIYLRSANDVLEEGSARELTESERIRPKWHPADELNEYLYFRLDFFSPAGQIEIIAKDFEFEPFNESWV